MSRFIAAYDVSHPSQRTKIATLLGEYGIRLQRSVFEVDLEPPEIPLLQRRVGPLLALNDSFDLIPIDPNDRRPRLRWQHAVAPRALAFV